MNKLVYKSYIFTDADIISGSIHISNAMVCESLEADTLEVEVLSENGEDQTLATVLLEEFFTSSDEAFTLAGNGTIDLSEYTYGTPIEYYYDEELVGRFYVQSVQRIGKDRYTISCTSIVGMLIYQQHTGGIYTGETVDTVISSIMGNVDYTIDSDVASVNVYGHLPIASARDNLQQVLFSVGASIMKDENKNLRICYNQPDEAKAITDDRLFSGGGVNYITPATKVVVTEHDYYKALTVDDTMLYDNTTGITANHLFVTFQNPCHSVHSDTFTIEDTGANYAIISGTGILYGKEYVHATRTVEIDTGIETVEPNEVTVTDATLVSSVNSVYVAKRVANYYSATYEINASLIAGAESTGNLIEFTDPFEAKSQGYIREIDYTMSGVLKGDAKIVANWKPAYVGNAYNKYIVVTQEMLVNGVWNVPPEIVGKKAQLILFGAGSGGDGGYDGGAGGACTGKGQAWITTWQAIAYFIFTAGGAGGAGGSGGHAGKIIKADINALEPSYTASFGIGGAGGAVNGGKGEEGTHSVFGPYDTDNGTRYDGTYINMVSGEPLAKVGANGISGVKGGDTGVRFSVDDKENRGQNGKAGENLPPYIGGRGADWYKYNDGRYYSYEGNGSGGGGAAYGSNGTDAVPMKVAESGTGYDEGEAGSGADAVPPANATFAGGGAGGNGGGGSGARGWNQRQGNSSSPLIRSSRAGTIGHGTKGADGGNGFALIYYGDE